MKYRVKVAFNDLLDNNYLYKVGDKYPRDGVKASKDRIDELSTTKNKAKIVLIEAVEEPVKEAVVEPSIEVVEPANNTGFSFTKNEIMRMSVAKLRTLADELGLDSTLSGAKLKPLIVEKLGL